VRVIQECAVLAGGLATRLRPLTETIPKSLVDIAGEPFLAHQLRLLVKNGIRRAVLCTGYLGEMIRDYAGNGARFGLELDYSADGPKLLGTAGAIRQALPKLGERFFVVYGDSYLPCDWQKAAEVFVAGDMLGLMTVHRNEGRWDSSNVEFAEGRILVYDKKSKAPEMRHIDYGLGAFRRAGFEDIPPATFYDLATLYQDLLQRGQLAAVEVAERFYEVGSLAGIEELAEFMKKR
jgi:NDP-sugar pyrophosphorylase family protein